MKDLEVYLLAGRRFADGAGLYGNISDQALPIAPPLHLPADVGRRDGARRVAPVELGLGRWTLLDLALLCWVVRDLVRALPGPARRTPVVRLGVPGRRLRLTAPVLSVFDLGQIGIVLMALVLADTLPRSTRLPRGVLVGVATAIKLLPGVFVLYWAVTERWRAVLVASCDRGGPVARDGAAPPRDLEHLLVPRSRSITDRAGDAGDVFNQSLNGLLQRVGWTSTAVWAALGMAVLVVGLRRAREAHLAGDELAAISLVALAGRPCLADLVGPPRGLDRAGHRRAVRRRPNSRPVDRVGRDDAGVPRRRAAVGSCGRAARGASHVYSPRTRSCSRLVALLVLLPIDPSRRRALAVPDLGPAEHVTAAHT